MLLSASRSDGPERARAIDRGAGRQAAAATPDRRRARSAGLALAFFATLAVLAAAPSASSHNGANPPKPPPVRGTGIGVVRFDFNLPKTWLTRQYSYVVVGPSEVDRVKRFRGLALIYKAAMSLDTQCASSDKCPTGVTYREAISNGWVLKSSSGREIARGVDRLGDVGHRGFQNRWLKNVSKFLRVHHARGVFIDEASANVDLWTHGVFPAKYPANQDWEDAMARFISYVGPRLKKQGFYVLLSTLKYIAGDPSTEDGTLDVKWWHRIGKDVSGLCREWWQQNPNPPYGPYTNNPGKWTGHWPGWLRLATAAQSMRRDFFGIQWGNSSDLPLLRYGRASFLLVWNGRGGAYLFAARDRVGPTSTDWAVDVGQPRGRRQKVGVGWKRKFSRGIVVLNPSEATSQRFALGGRYQLPGAEPVTAVTVPPVSALILRRLRP
jgi:hypothetical protein